MAKATDFGKPQRTDPARSFQGARGRCDKDRGARDRSASGQECREIGKASFTMPPSCRKNISERDRFVTAMLGRVAGAGDCARGVRRGAARR
ncbi:MAG: hypothetical protein CML29_12960 [Rhizobiales bacterium]|nr:hypothetical protein [Hyphomicrobiales bacterium]MBG18561.1 hypothetical protein [Hyphomicrobiales bacterium]